MAGAEVRILLRWWLGIPVISPSKAGCLCPGGCGGVLDPFGDHLVACKKSPFLARHSGVQDVVHGVCLGGQMAVRREVHAVGLERPADLLLWGWDGGRPGAVDFVITHPLAPSKWPLRIESVRGHLGEAERKKVVKNGGACGEMGWHCLPAAAHTWGGWGPEGEKTLRQVFHRATGHLEGRWKGEAVARFWEEVGTALMRGVAAQLRKGMGAMASGGESEPLVDEAGNLVLD